MTWNAILEESRLPLLTQFGTRLDMTETQISTPGALNLEQICTMLDAVSGLDEQTALILPGGFLYGIDARTVRKNLRVVQLRRFKSKREAIQSQSTPDQLIQERLEEMRKAYQSDQDKLRLDYGGINYRGITSNRTNNYSISDAIRGYLHAQLADDLIDVRRYDRLESLLDKTMRGVPEIDRILARRVLMAIRRRRTMTDKLKEVPESVRRLVLTIQAERVVSVPSTSRERRVYGNIRFRKLPLAFPDDAFPDLNQEYHATWTDVYAQPSCSCNDKAWFITYLRPGENWQCVHEIAAFRAMAQRDWEGGKPATYPDPYIATSPFFKPTPEAIDFYRKLRKQVFVDRGAGRFEHLPETYIDIWLLKQVQRGKLDLL